MNMKLIIHNIWCWIVKFKKLILIIAICCLLLLLFSFFKYVLTTDRVYYIHKDKGSIITERIHIQKIGHESKIQAFLRVYLAGSNKYIAKIPFDYNVRLLNSSHSEDDTILILNWNSYFYKVLETKMIEKEIALLLLSLKENFPIKEVYFLVEGSRLKVDLENIDLSSKIALKNISKNNIKKN